jgi:hypothetical protein
MIQLEQLEIIEKVEYGINVKFVTLSIFKYFKSIFNESIALTPGLVIIYSQCKKAVSLRQLSSLVGLVKDAGANSTFT